MANVLTALDPTIIATGAIDYLRTRTALLGRVYTETRGESDIEAGGNTIRIVKPGVAKTAQTVTPGNSDAFAAVTDLAPGSVDLTFSNHKGHKVKANQLESRIAQGNFQTALEIEFGSMMDSIANEIDGSLTALYTGAGETAGTGGSALTDATIRDAIKDLADNNVMFSPDRVTFVGGTSAYFADLLGIDKYSNYLNVGRPDVLNQGKLGSLYNIYFDYSPNIKSTTTSGVTTVHNLLFDKYAFVIGFCKFEPVNKYAAGAGAQVEESTLTDPETGLTVRAMKYFDPKAMTWYWSIDCKWGVAVLDANRACEVKS